MKLKRWIRSKVANKPLMMTCRELEEFIVDYIDGNLPYSKKIMFVFHLIMCDECNSYINAYKKSIELGKKHFEEIDKDLQVDPPDKLIEIISKLKD